MGKHQHWNQVLYDELCNEMKKFEERPDRYRLEGIEKLIKSICGLQEVEAASAMRQIAEDRYGYDSESGEFEKEIPYYKHGMFNARRRRDSRGRFTSNMYNDGREYMDAYDGFGYPYSPYIDYPMYNEAKMQDGTYKEREQGESYNSGGRDGRKERYGGRSGGGSSDTYNAQDEKMYMIRQQDGMPIVTPYAHHDMNSIPKKLTKEQYDEWMNGLVNMDGSSGPHWTKEQTKKVQQKKQLENIDECAFWAAMNATYSDLCEFFKKHSLDTIDAYCEYVIAFWFEDEDAVGNGQHNPEKLAAYYSAVVDK